MGHLLKKSKNRMSNINTDHFFEITVSLLLQTVDAMIQLTGKEERIHEKGILSVDGKESRGWCIRY